ncbi:protocatechuate 3,4-dioxygenase beta subunit [Ulvibacter sp. MAR_2010_11]|uniref:dioxygenase family protein n=1 Tax=Ulvibacter sp. MAR_2010_11 TaxID=1250229 RepID=UPI000C2C78AA|nr:intradiol ring-cleavage dioxygenase [Ulvibacter sp. MAR_2010_11]PKA81995.1 protocatechuate 3,4-dioxygenase beta subunit [Ulvibacter sp. MAR_2010_11]
MKNILGILFLVFIISSCKGQTEKVSNRLIGGPCEDCDAALDYKVLNIDPEPTVTINGFNTTDPKIKITGTVLKPDGKTPADNVILYVYQTNRKGFYEPSENPVGWEKRHGKFRGWMKTGSDGKFEFYTFRPAPYPDGREPEHIHLYIKEPGKNPYYVDNYLFDDDPMLTNEERKSIDKRGGSGIIELENNNGIFSANRDIILGLNIPDY